MTRRLWIALAALLVATPASAYDSETHAGLTERAALASSLHKRLIEHLGRPLGLYEPLELRPGSERALEARLATLDPEGGYVPDQGRMAAIEWLVAGAAVEGVPAERLRHHFYDPSTGRGLEQVEGRALQTRLASVEAGISSLRSVFTGSGFDGSGMASTEWLSAADNDWGRGRFLDELERSASLPTAAERNGALARALVAAGSMLHVLQQAGDPIFVRNDYRVALEGEGARYQRFVRARYGRLAVPPPDGAAAQAAHLTELFHASDGSGLADRTQTRFFSPGTLPDSGRYPAPSVSPGRADNGYVAGAVPHLVRYTRSAEGVRYRLDERCFADYAAALLPETGRYAAAAIELLFRGQLGVEASSEGTTVTVHEVALGAGTLSLYADVARRPRALVKAIKIRGAADGERVAELPLPPGARRVAAVFRGVDGAGEPLVLVQETSIE